MSFKDKLKNTLNEINPISIKKKTSSLGSKTEPKTEPKIEKKETEEIKKPIDSQNKELDDFEIDFKKIENIKTIFKNNFIYYLLLIPILLLNLFIRTRNLENLQGKYLLGLDPYHFYRLSGFILEQGNLPSLDIFRNAPIGVSYLGNHDLFPYFLAYWYKFVHLISPNTERIFAHIIYPPIISTIGLIFFFLLVKEIFNEKSAIISTAFLAVVPAYLYRNMAGFADHEAICMLFIFASLWFFVKFRKELNLKNKITFGFLSGIIAAFAGLLWSGFLILIIIISIFIIIDFLLENTNKKYFFGILAWTLGYLPLIIIYKFSLANLAVILPIFSIFLIIINTLLIYLSNKTNISKFDKIQNPLFAIPIAIFIGFPLIFKNYKNLLTSFLNPAGSSKVSFTTAEIIGGSRNIWGEFSWILILALLSIIILNYLLIENKKYMLITNSIISILATIAIFTNISKEIQLISVAIILISYIGIRKQINKEKAIYLLPLIAILISAYLARSAARFPFVAAPFICLTTGFTIYFIANSLYKSEIKITATIPYIIALFLIFTIGQASTVQASYSGSGLPGQWDNSMTFIRTNTPEDSIIAHWWDYGYWTQAVGERASIQDGGKPGGDYMIYTLARYGMTAINNNNALTYFKSHNTSYLLFSKEEIGKYHAFSYLGSDKNSDRESTIGIFTLNEEKEVRNGTKQIYTGGWMLDKDITINKAIIPEKQAAIAGFILTRDKNNKIAEPPIAVIYYNKKQIEEPISCIYEKNKKQEFNITSNIGGCIKLAPLISNQNTINNEGTIFYLSEKTKDTLFTRLYILNNTYSEFEEVYNDKLPLAIYNGNLIGPIRIWKLNYPEDIREDPIFLASTSKEFEENYII